MNLFQNTRSGMGLLKEYYPDQNRRTALTPMQSALKSRREKLSQTLLDPDAKAVNNLRNGNKIINQFGG